MTRTSVKKGMEQIGGKPIKHQATINRILSITHHETQALVTILYLTGGRIQEIIPQIPSKYIKKARKNKKKQIMKDENGCTLYETRLNPEWQMYRLDFVPSNKGITPISISKESDVLGDWLHVTLRNEKNKTKRFKTIVCPVRHEGKLITLLTDYIKGLGNDTQIFRKTRVTYWRYIKAHAGFFQFPHFLRALRVTHLKNKYGFTGTQIKDFMGWSDERPLTNYELWFDPVQFKQKMK